MGLQSLDTFLRAAFTLIFAAGAAFILWVGIQSLRQAAVLRRLAADGHLEGRFDRPFAVHGAVRIESPLRTSHGIDCLWYREIRWERRHEPASYRGSRFDSGSGWRKTSTKERLAGFSIDPGGYKIRLRGTLTEVHSTQSFLETRDDRLQRIRITWLPPVVALTALGRLGGTEKNPMLEADAHFGLLLSPDAPETTARRESLKGWFGVAGAILLAAVTAMSITRGW